MYLRMGSQECSDLQPERLSEVLRKWSWREAIMKWSQVGASSKGLTRDFCTRTGAKMVGEQGKEHQDIHQLKTTRQDSQTRLRRSARR